jgi:hypothetical protein
MMTFLLKLLFFISFNALAQVEVDKAITAAKMMVKEALENNEISKYPAETEYIKKLSDSLEFPFHITIEKSDLKAHVHEEWFHYNPGYEKLNRLVLSKSILSYPTHVLAQGIIHECTHLLELRKEVNVAKIEYLIMYLAKKDALVMPALLEMALMSSLPTVASLYLISDEISYDAANLRSCIMINDKDCVKYLMKKPYAKSLISMQDYKGNTALNYIEIYERSKLKKLLKK